MAWTLVFDVNETLLDLRVLDPVFTRAFGDARVRRQWFSLVLQNAMTLTMTGRYRDFLGVAAASLEMVAARHCVTLSDADKDAIRQTMGNLPPHDDVLLSLQRLHRRGFRMAALTNAPPDAATRQLTHAGITPMLDRIMTVDSVRKFKPAREVYESAAATLGITTKDICMVAAHDWDIAGAMAAGCAGALVLRPDVVVNPLYPAPDIVARDLSSLADELVARGTTS